MKHLRHKIGYNNMAVISLIGLLVFFCSLLFFGSEQTGTEIKKHVFIFFSRQLFFLLTLSAIFTTGVIVINILYDLVAYKKLFPQKLLAIFLRSLLISFVTGSIGLTVMLCNI